MQHWPLRRWAGGALAAIIAGAVMGVPTGIISTSLYTRMTAVTWWDYAVWGVSSLLIGLTVATYIRESDAENDLPDRRVRTAGATLLSALAVGCPVCNKAVVALLGTSGAMTYWAPLQPLLGATSIILVAVGLAIRLRASTACRVAG